MVSDPISSRLPTRVRHEFATIHTAELAGMLAALRYRRPASGTMERSTLAPGGPLIWMSRLAFAGSGLAGVDFRSHQGNWQIPKPVIVAGNEAQDAAALLPSDSPFCPMSVYLLVAVRIPVGERMHGDLPARCDPRIAPEAPEAWQKRTVQGKHASLHKAVYTPALRKAFVSLTTHLQWTCQ